MLTGTDRANVMPVLKSIGAYVYLIDVLDDGTFRYFALNWDEGKDAEIPYSGTIIGKRPEEVFEAEHASRLNQYYKQSVESRSQIEFEGGFETSGGKHWTSHFLAPIFNLNGQIVRIMGTIVDITKRKRAEQALKESKERFHALYNNNPARYMTIDPNGNILSVNRFGAEYFGFTREELVDTSLLDYIHDDDKYMAEQFLQYINKEPEKLHRAELRGLMKNGDAVWMSNTARVTKDEDGNPVILIVSDDTSKAHELSDKLSYQATHDSLTGLVNRREFERRLSRMIETAWVGTSEHVLYYLDLDQFKVINDTCGHRAGDELLRQLGSLLTDEISEDDTLCRLGGDEFAIIMEDCTLDKAQITSNSLCRKISDFIFLWKDKRFSVGVSIGLVAITSASGDITEVLSAAERACYEAKDNGRNRVHVFREDDKALKKRRGDMEWVNRIKTALTENRLHIYFQTIAPVDSDHDAGECYEFLLRLEDEQGRMIPSEVFLPAAENYNLSNRLDRWMVRSAFAWIEAHPNRLDKLFFCTINLSGTTLGDHTFIDFVQDQIRRTKIPADKVCFEITETAAISNLTSALYFINALRETGFRFALDDFGSGWSSLAYLKDFPVDYLKIDGKFVKDIADDPIDLALVKSIHGIGRLMGKNTIAEHVESDLIREKLREVGVDYCQGYSIGRPSPVEDMRELD